ACSSVSNNPLTVFADPGKYQYFSCEQIVANRNVWSAKEQELKMLMDKADQGAGGAVVNVLAYKADYVAASEELKVLDVAERAELGEGDVPTHRRHAAIRARDDVFLRDVLGGFADHGGHLLWHFDFVARHVDGADLYRLGVQKLQQAHWYARVAAFH